MKNLQYPVIRTIRMKRTDCSFLHFFILLGILFSFFHTFRKQPIELCLGRPLCASHASHVIIVGIYIYMYMYATCLVSVPLIKQDGSVWASDRCLATTSPSTTSTAASSNHTSSLVRFTQEKLTSLLANKKQQ